MVSRKRGREEMESSEPAPEPSMLDRLRNTWELSNLMQYIFIFGRAVKIDDDLTIEDLETECLSPEPSKVLSDIGLALLKYVSSHRGLTPEIFDEYTRRQYVAKAPQRNPFGEDEEPKKFAEFDVFIKLKVLFQLSQWTLINADRMRERMSDTKDNEQTQWRIEEIGYDRDERYYFVLDDNRLYRRTDPAPPPPLTKPKVNSKKGRTAARASKRRKTNEIKESANEAEFETVTPAVEEDSGEDDGLGGRKWECIAVTLGEYQAFLETINKSRNFDEKALHRRITEDVLSVIEKAEESQWRKKQKQEREVSNMHKLATAKRSSRLEAKQERERQEHEAAETERKRKAGLAAAKQDLEQQKKMEEARESRMLTREQRLKEREFKRVLHEEELTKLSEENKKVEAGEAKRSERYLKTEMEKHNKDLAALAEDDEWIFDCSKCAKHGTNFDDGAHSVACEKCNVWQHSSCLGISQGAAEKDDFHFVCHDCLRRAEDAMKPKIPSLKFHLGSSTSPPSQNPKVIIPQPNESKKRKSGDETTSLSSSKKLKFGAADHSPANPSASRSPHYGQNSMYAAVMNGPTLSPQGQVPPTSYSGNQASQAPPPPPDLRSPPAPPPYANGYNSCVSHQNGYIPQLPPQTFQPPYTTNGAHQTGYRSHQGTHQAYQSNHQPQNTGWSARYTPPHQAPNQQTYGPPSPSQNPFANSFDRQRPPSSHSGGNMPSPMKNGPILSPPPHTPSASDQMWTQSLQPNGYTNNQALLPTGSPTISPRKQQSPPISFAMQQPSSSPVTHQPPLPPNAPSSPGFSPTKHSPPQVLNPTHNLSDKIPVLPPATNLLPSST